MANATLFRSLVGALISRTNARNEAGGPAYLRSPEQALAQLAATGCLNATFYAGADVQLDRVVDLADRVAPEFVAKAALYTRERAFMKDMPALLLAALSRRDTAFHRGIESDTQMSNWVTIDGSEGEGGGQLLRTALSLSLVTSTPFRIVRIRAGRRKPGLLRQHLTAVQAAAQVGRARVSGAELGSQSLTFEPSEIQPGQYEFAVGTAGSATLVFQTLLPALLCGRSPSRITVEGGTHNPFAPPYDFLAGTFLPILGRMGASVTASLERCGFYPAGGGRIAFEIAPCSALRTLTLLDRGATQVRARSLVASLPEGIAKRELGIVRERLALERHLCRVESIDECVGPGNVLLIVIEAESMTEIVTGFGIKGVSAEKVASDACDEAERYLKTDVPVGSHLADQLLIPMALAGGGSFRTLSPSAHTETNASVIRRFLDVPIAIDAEAEDTFRITIGPR